MAWLIGGLILIIVEVMSGSFYLLVLGLAAFAGALASYFGASVIVQVMFASLFAARAFEPCLSGFGQRDMA